TLRLPARRAPRLVLDTALATGAAVRLGRRGHRAMTSMTGTTFVPQPVERLAVVRILAPLAVLGFLSSRIAEAPEWIGDAGFSVPDLGDTGDYHQPLYLPPLP